MLIIFFYQKKVITSCLVIGMAEKTKEPIRTAILGATGYAGAELLRLLANHPIFKLTYASSETYAQKSIDEVFPHLSGAFPLTLKSLNLDEVMDVADVVFIVLPNGHAIKLVPPLLEARKKIVDFSGDFRLKNPLSYQQWYHQEAAEEHLLQQAIYGLIENLSEENTNASLIANPGCYATAALLAALPAFKAGIVDLNSAIFDGKSGISGAGRGLALDYHFCEASENMYPYQVAGLHRHTPEIEQELSIIAKQSIKIQFTPHVVPLVRGLIMTVYLNLITKTDLESVYSLYKSFYKDSFFIRLGNTNQTQVMKQIRGTNACQINLYIDQRTNRLIVISAIDNLIKGAAGQALQNMNLICGLADTTGLRQLSTFYP